MEYAGLKQERKQEQAAECYHCGDSCGSYPVRHDGKEFCCEGCKAVYDLLSENQLCSYYDFSRSPGITPGDKTYEYLDHESISAQLIHFRDGSQAHVSLYIPGMHCSSCIWLLENLHRLHGGIKSSTADFPRKEVSVIFDTSQIPLSQLASLLSSTGYAPSVNLQDLETAPRKATFNREVLKIGIAGFAFGNIMMLSFPEYFSSGRMQEQEHLGTFFSYLNLALSLPVFFYSASGFFISAFKSIRYRFLNIDGPIALAILVTFARSVYEILSGTGAGYLDSMTGIVFFMLIGRYFQHRTYDRLSFDRDYKSYFPAAVTLKAADGTETPVPVTDLREGDMIRVRNGELIPADALLLSGRTHVDYSFITGEALPVRKVKGELIYAGARQLDGSIEAEIVRPVSQSYLTRLWNGAGKKPVTKDTDLVDAINRWFTLAVLLTAFSSAGYWSFHDPSKALNAFTAVLIVACPCGLLLTSSFTNGNLLRIFGRNKLYLKNAEVIESLASADTIIFDKTGTITRGSEVTFEGEDLTSEEILLAVSLASQSSHPLSRAICQHYSGTSRLSVNAFEETAGQGIRGEASGHILRMGSARYVAAVGGDHAAAGTYVYFSIDGRVTGRFCFSNAYRSGLSEAISHLRGYRLGVLSGDNPAERGRLERIFGPGTGLLFGQKPDEKKDYIRELTLGGHRVIMLGDGLNDAGALAESSAGIAVSDDTNHFSPACDAILDGSSLGLLPRFLRMARSGRRVIAATFVFSLLYNVIGLLFAVQGTLSPVIAAILMPSSTLSIILATTVSTSLIARARGL